ncbi:unnamed protein product [Gongylonema pulchrum]|uniref:Cyclic nucleotide-binding domain-containing protein n=1 Tax=Gongylonema pulchrum TaxID=637853 RepID=A0A183EVP4_9BILA|nr:unnamed protein product [Gongylonema pulchrum]
MLELPPDWSVQSKDLVVWQYKENEYLIRPGDKDESVIIVLEGIIAVYISVRLNSIKKFFFKYDRDKLKKTAKVPRVIYKEGKIFTSGMAVNDHLPYSTKKRLEIPCCT